MKGKHKKSCNRFDYGGIVSSEIADIYKNSLGGGIAGTIATSLDGTQKQANNIVKSSYNLNPMASNNDEVMDLYNNYGGLTHIPGLNDKDKLNAFVKNATTGIGGLSSLGANPLLSFIGGSVVGGVNSEIQYNNVEKDIASTNSVIDLYNRRQQAALANAKDNSALRQKLGFEAGYFRDGGDINYFNNGGTHEQNPFGGIPQGIAPNNLMNVVEEGEVKWESPDGDYIFSNNHRLNKNDVADNLLPNNLKGKTIAEAAKKILKESDERPNDYISDNGKNHFLGILRDINESKNPQNQEVNSFRRGGEPKHKTEKHPWGMIRSGGLYTGENAYIVGTPRISLETNKTQKEPKENNPYNSKLSFLVGPSGFVVSKRAETPQNTEINPLEGAMWFQKRNDVSGDPALGEPYNYTVYSAPIPGNENPSSTNTSSGRPRFKTSPETPYVATSNSQRPLGKISEPKATISESIDKPAELLEPRITSSDTTTTTGNPYQNFANRISGIANKLRQYKQAGRPTGSNIGNFAEKIGDTAMAMAPIFANALDNPNYNYVNEIRHSFNPVDTPYVSSANYMRYTPIDVDYLTNQIKSQSGATAGNIMNLSGGNRSTAMAGLFGNDYNTKLALGNAYLQSDLQNMQNYQNVQKHNTSINEFDINNYVNNARFNAQGLAHARQTAAMLGQQEFDAWKDRQYANLSQGLTNLQNLKKDRWTNNQLQMLVDSGAIVWDPRTGQYVAKDKTTV